MIVIIDYGLGNLSSVQNMFKKIGVKDVLISNKLDEVENANKLLLPGVGSFDAGMRKLEETGLIPLLHKKVKDKTPVLGICLGMQMLTNKSEEGKLNGLGWINAETIKFKFDGSESLKIPHMGWNYVKAKKENPLLSLGSKSRFYFVHSYHVKCIDEEQVIATSNYGSEFTCMVNKDNVFGAQFHPEKSLKFGMELLKNFASL